LSKASVLVLGSGMAQSEYLSVMLAAAQCAFTTDEMT
jgi:hypothetical protein